jgi:hypothetical protein
MNSERPFSVPKDKWEKDLFDNTISEAEKILEKTTRNVEVPIPELTELQILKHQHSREEDKYIITGGGIHTEVIFNIDTKQIINHESYAESSDLPDPSAEEHTRRVQSLLEFLVPPPIGQQEEMDI